MIDMNRWHETNDRYLSDVLEWLRLRLSGMAPQAVTTDKPRRRRFWRSRKRTPADGTKSHSRELANAAQRVAAAADGDPAPAALLLAERFGLTEFELNVLLLAAAMEFDPRIAAMCATANGDSSRRWPSFGLVLELFDDTSWDALAPERPLRYWRLVEIEDLDSEPLTARPLRADERIVSYMRGLQHFDHRLTPLVDTQIDELPPSQEHMVDRLVESIEGGFGQRGSVPIQLVGASGASKHLVASHAAHQVGLDLYRMSSGSVPTSAAQVDNLARLWERETLLLPIALLVDDADIAGNAADDSGGAARLIAKTGGLVFASVRERTSLLLGDDVAFDTAKPTRAEQRTAWLAGLEPLHADSLAGQFNLELNDIRGVLASAADVNHVGERAAGEIAWDACRALTRPHMQSLARRIDAMATWEDIALSEDEADTLQRLVGQVVYRSRVYDEWGFRDRMNRGLGISALFCGESGTGKTMAAEVIANELKLDLYRIDLSAVVDKYIGETEKALRRLFDAAEDGGAILFFDEADALFGKRSEVKDSHDRYANIEINYLLQRMESFGGLAILATNSKDLLDKAFLRRLRFVVNFPYPDLSLRTRIWDASFPKEVPTEDLDFERLGEFRLTGGNIHNAALAASFLAAEADSAVTLEMVLVSIRDEMRKMDRPINETLFWTESCAEKVAS